MFVAAASVVSRADRYGEEQDKAEPPSADKSGLSQGGVLPRLEGDAGAEAVAWAGLLGPGRPPLRPAACGCLLVA